MSKSSYDPNKIDKIREEIKNPEGNAIAKLESIYHIASALSFDGSKELTELLGRELYTGYGIEEVPPYRKIPVETTSKEINDRNLKYLFTDPLSKYSMYGWIDIQIIGNISINAESVVYYIVSGIEETPEMKAMFKFLYAEGTRKMEEERVAEQKSNKRERIDFTGIGMKPIVIDDKDMEDSKEV
jgi:hypothetical protein